MLQTVFLTVLYDMLTYTRECFICTQETNVLRVHFFDYLQTFIYQVTTSTIVYSTKSTVCTNGDYIAVPISNIIEVIQNMHKTGVCSTVDLVYLNSTTITLGDSTIVCRTVPRSYGHLWQFEHRPEQRKSLYNVVCPSEILKYGANIAILSSSCRVNIIVQNNILYLQFCVDQELGHFKHMFKIEKKDDTSPAEQTVNISPKVFKVIMNQMTSSIKTETVCWITQYGLFFRINNIVFMCQNIIHI